MSSANVNGFNLTLGLLYEDRWFNAEEPYEDPKLPCERCFSNLTIHKLHKTIFAFGMTIIKRCTVSSCPSCLDEQIIAHYKPKTQKRTPSSNNLAKFKSLPPDIQQRIIDEVLNGA